MQKIYTKYVLYNVNNMQKIYKIKYIPLEFSNEKTIFISVSFLKIIFYKNIYKYLQSIITNIVIILILIKDYIYVYNIQFNISYSYIFILYNISSLNF